MSTKIEDRIYLILHSKLIPFDKFDRFIEDQYIEYLTQEEEAMYFAGMLPNKTIKAIDADLKKKNGWVKLEELTGISSKKWRNLFGFYQKPTHEQIEAIAKLWPEYAFWLATGITDTMNGHIAPDNVATFPEASACYKNYSSGEYFRLSLELLDILFKAAKVDTTDQKARLDAISRKLLMVDDRYYGEAPINQYIQVLAKSERYKTLIDLRRLREEVRQMSVFNNELQQKK